MFRGGSDTEVIVVGYEQLGDALWPRLRGMFALALWDARDEELRLVRDPLGQKPLYYVAEPAEDGLRRLCFASELRALLSAGAVPLRIDAQALLGYLTWGSVPEPGTVVAGVRPATWPSAAAACGGDRLRLLPTTAYVPPGRKAIRSRRPSRRRSSCPARRLPIPCAGTWPPTSPSECCCPEASTDQRRHLGPSRRPARTAGCLHPGHLCPGMADELAEPVIPLAPCGCSTRSGRCQPRPPPRRSRLAFGARSAVADGYNTFLICARVRAAGLKVVLSGAGGDELFFGYGLHRRFARAWAAYRHLPSARCNRRSPTSATPPGCTSDSDGCSLAIRRLLLQTSICFNEQHPSGPRWSAIPEPAAAIDKSSPWAEGLSRVQAYERRRYLRHTLLRDGDVLSMAHGVELRLPFCDPGLWDVARALRPWSYAETGAPRRGGTVGDTRVAAAAQPKRGFELPLDDWLRGPLAQKVERLLLDRDQVAAAGLQPTSLRRLWQTSGRGAGSACRAAPLGASAVGAVRLAGVCAASGPVAG